MAKSPKSAAKVPDVSRCVSSRKIAEALGGGEVRYYNLKKNPLPDVVNTPSEKEAAACDFWLVHFPSRKCVAVPAGHGEALRLLKKLEAGKDELGWIPRPTTKKAQARARARVCVKNDKEKQEDEPEQKTAKRTRFTAVPGDMDFDRAMKHVFPNARITQEIERLLEAEDEVFDREGVAVGSKPAWMVRKEAVKLMIEHAQGRASEKPPPPPDKKKVSYEELERMILGSKATRLVLKNLIEKADAVPVAAVPVVPAKPAEEGKA